MSKATSIITFIFLLCLYVCSAFKCSTSPQLGKRNRLSPLSKRIPIEYLNQPLIRARRLHLSGYPNPIPGSSNEVHPRATHIDEPVPILKPQYVPYEYYGQVFTVPHIHNYKQ